MIILSIIIIWFILAIGIDILLFGSIKAENKYHPDWEFAGRLHRILNISTILIIIYTLFFT